MLKALGFVFLDSQGNDVGEGAQALSKVAAISSTRTNPRLAECNSKWPAMITNPLCGKNGATYIYGPQKA